MGINTVNSTYHRKTIMSALKKEKNPADNKPAFPAALCSRLSQGYPVMFNYLGIDELEKVCQTGMRNMERLMEKQYYKKFEHGKLLPISLVFREGRQADARQLKGEAEKFLKTEIFKFASLYENENLEDVLEEIDTVRFEIQPDKVYNSLYETKEKSNVLLIAGSRLSRLYQKYVKEVNWLFAETLEEAFQILSAKDVNMILLDLWIRRKAEKSETGEEDDYYLSSDSILKTLDGGQDFIPLFTSALDEGRKILCKLHEYFPAVPIYLLSLIESTSDKDNGGDALTISIDMTHNSSGDIMFGKVIRRQIDDELFLACVRAGGARGLLSTDFGLKFNKYWPVSRNHFAESLVDINSRFERERKAMVLARERKVMNFETISLLDKENRRLLIKLRNFSVARVIESVDIGEMVEDVKRPDTLFKDVIGAKGAKKSLQFLVNWLKDSRKYKAMDIRPPKGILLYGPPGTGKTMLARALAGESSCAFIESSATRFVGKYAGSGPQNVRNLFDRARRYSPSIVFIDEIDSIGRKRSGTSHGGERAEEATLNTFLTEMDGFATSSEFPAIVIAATNLAEVLDPALKRRFDREIEVDKPAREDRLLYLEKTLAKRKLCKVSNKVIERLAGQSVGMTIADLERIVYEAGIMAVQSDTALTEFLELLLFRLQ